MEEKCENCKFVDIESGSTISWDICRKNAPQKTHGVGTGSDNKRWPAIDRLRDWCGEWELNKAKACGS